MADYQGMRWFKCDLQMQTPADALHWRGAQMGSTSGEQRAAALTYVRRCYEVGLEAIAITDHNFLSKSFIPLLQEAIHELIGEFGYRMVLFPGFEFEANVGKGVHVLGIFEPDANLDELDHLLTECGVPFPRIQGGVLAKSTRGLSELLQCIQQNGTDGKQRGIVVMPHALKHDGLFDNGKVSEWLQQTEYLNPELLAVEVPKPVQEMSPGWRTLLSAGNGCDPAWKRRRPIACIMSSDNKALTKEENAENYIGMRYTWIKMSEPSVEALRQAFLDPLSRIQLMGGRPSDALVHPRITKVSVRGAKFLDDQEVSFSEGLNCVIGGRGSGKSSLLEYLRFALQVDSAAKLDEASSLDRKRAQLRDSLSHLGAEVRVSFQAEGGVADTLVYRPSNPPATQRHIEGREVTDLQTVLRQLRVQFFSQGELSRMTDGERGQAQVLALIDASCGKPLSDLQAEEQNLQAKAKSLFQAARDEQRLQAEIKTLRQEAVEIDRQLQARAAVQGDSVRDQLARRANRHLDAMSSEAEQVSAAVSDLVGRLSRQPPSLPEEAKEWPAASWFQVSAQGLSSARNDLAQELGQALHKYQDALAKILDVKAIAPAREAIGAAQEQFRVACAEKGIQPGDIARLQELEETKQSRLNQVRDRELQLEQVKQQAKELPALLASLHDIWKRQFALRKETADAIQASVASQTVRVTTTYMRDKASFVGLWKRLAPRDGRGKLARKWDELGDALFQSWLERGTEESPWETVEAGRTDPGAIMFFIDGPLGDDLQPALVAHIDSMDVRPIWEEVRVTRVSDGIDVELLRDDQSTAGKMSGALSEGQRNTVLLNLMLARGDGPIVIDQPEDELDSSFIYKTLVKDLRATKQRRQLIIATHNANLPVNGDAELIYALEARDGRGKLLAEGGLDRAPVARAVLDIMEGSEQAFKRRSEKYHF